MWCRKLRLVLCFFAGMLATWLVGQPAQAELEFGIPAPMPVPFNLDGGYGYPWLTEDEKDIYFVADRPGPNSSDPYSTGAFDIWRSHRDSVGDPWGPFVNMGDPINTPEMAEIAPSFTEDMQEFYFMRALSPFGLPEGDLFVSQRQLDDSWGAPEPLAALNTPDGSEAYPTISPDGKTLYFNTVAPNPNYPNPTGLDWNMFVARRDFRTDPFTDPEFFFGGYGTVTPDGLTHIMLGYPEFADFYDVPHVGDGDLYIRTRSSDDQEFGPLQLLQPPVNSTGQLLPPPLTGAGLECCASFSASGSTFYFTSIRPGTDATGPTGFVDLWQAPLAESVAIDINPGGDANPINWLIETVLSAAILSTEEFNALDVDVATILFGDPLLIADGAAPVSPTSTASEDVDGDGIPDLSLELSISEMRTNGVIGRRTTQGYFAGQMTDGSDVAGRDAMTIIPEPGSVLLMLAGILGLSVYRRR